MNHDGDPFSSAPADPFASSPEHVGVPTSYGRPGSWTPVGITHRADRRHGFGRSALNNTPPLNTFAALTPVLGVLVPPAGIAVGHLALPQIKRTGERGWLVAITGLVLSYLMCALLAFALLWLVTFNGKSKPDGRVTASTPTAPTSVLTSVAPAPSRPHDKLDLTKATVGKCVEIEKRDEGGEVNDDDALDLYEVPCQHHVGVYTVVARVSADTECNSTYVAAPGDHGFAVCLNRY